MRRALVIAAVGMLAACSVMGFEPPGLQQRLEAIGPTNGLSAKLQRAFVPGDLEGVRRAADKFSERGVQQTAQNAAADAA